MIKLPSLNALRAFEVAARCGSFSVASDELGVSSAAVSLQVKNLEKHIGKKLFLRRGNRIFLTDAGQAIYPNLATTFDQLSQAISLLQENPGRPGLVISILPALAERWLVTRIHEFRQFSETSVDIRVENDPIDPVRENVDLRITYDTTFYEGYQSVPILLTQAVPVCSPKFWEAHCDQDGILTNVPNAKLIHNHWGVDYLTQPDWSSWFSLADPQRKIGKPNLTVSDTSLAISLAKQGMGMALVPEALIHSEVESGKLVVPSKTLLEMERQYVAIFANAKADNVEIRRFLELL
ncbi:MAG: LysR substrate-binding domain-containing protein [Rhizobiaceae bacterium]